MPSKKSLSAEQPALFDSLHLAHGVALVAGVDEAGRGPLAGPVVAAAVILDELQPWVGLPNILCRDFVVPELLQDAATPQALAAATLQWFDARAQAPDTLYALVQRFDALHESLQRNTPQLAADAIEKILVR